MQYHPISTENLKVDTVLNFNLYIQQKDRFVLFREKQHPFTEDILYRLIDNKVNTVFVSKEGIVEFKKYYSSFQDDKPSGLTKEGFAGPIFDKPENVEKYYKTFFDYYPIEKKTLIPCIKVGFNVYRKKDFDVELYFGPENQNEQQDIVPVNMLELSLPVVIQNNDIPLYKEYMQNITREYSRYETAPQELRCSIIRENSKLVIKDILEDPRSGKNIKESGNVVETLVDIVLNNEDNYYNLLKITSHDYYTYVHSLNVCTLSVGLGMAINLDRKSDLTELGLGAILHDMGKSLVDPRIINKPGRLTEEEYKIVQKHVIHGVSLLEKSNGKIARSVFHPILQHHEKVFGKGYPYCLKGEQIHLFGRITAIVDFYDAVTTRRPYKRAYKPFEALQLIAECQEDYDGELLKEFVMMLGRQAR